MRAALDPIASERRRGMLAMSVGLGALLVLAMLSFGLRGLLDKLSAEREALDATKAALSLVNLDTAKPSKGGTDPRARARSADLGVIANKLAVDWSGRLSELERALGDAVALHEIRLDGSKNEIEIRGEVKSGERLNAVMDGLTAARLDAKIVRMVRAGTAYEYAIQITWRVKS